MRIKMIVRTLFALLTWIAFSNHALCDRDNIQIREYVTELIDETKSVLDNTELAIDTKVERLSNIARTNLDVSWMSSRAIGRYKRKLSPVQLQEYNDIYKEYMLQSYSNLARGYEGEVVEIAKIKTFDIDAQEYIVSTNIIRRDGRPRVRVEYLIRNNAAADGKFRWQIMDIVTEGISMISTQHSEFMSIINNSGFEGLMDLLQKKVQERRLPKEET